MKKTTVCVISGGPIGNLTFLRSQLDSFAPVEIVCADGGARHLDALGLMPQVIVGDMDSIAPDLLERFGKQGSRIIPYPADKEKTDTWLALEYALDREPEQVILFGALGGRIDHALANVALLALAAERGIEARIIDEWCEMFVVTGEAAIDGEKGQTLSLLPLTTKVEGIALTGFQYPLDGGTMEIGKPYGISNRLASARGTVSVSSGLLLAISYGRERSRKEVGMAPPRVLTIAGSDSGGGAGIQADLKTIAALGGFGMSVITALTAQNTLGVQDVYELPPEFVEKQFDAVATDMGIDAAKTGMLGNTDILGMVARKIRQYGVEKLVVDPVLASTGGVPLIVNRGTDDAIKALIGDLIPLALVVTPNIPEAELLAGMKIASLGDMEAAATAIGRLGAKNVVVKGGHLAGDSTHAVDILYDGKTFTRFSAERIGTQDTHGTGCTFSAAIAAGLAGGKSVPDAVAAAKKHISAAIKGAWRIGGGPGPVDHTLLRQ